MFSKKSPRPLEFVTVVDNKTGKVLGKGRLETFQPNWLTISSGGKQQTFNAKEVHFKEYK